MARGGFTSSPSLFALDEAAPWVDSLGSQYLIHDLYFKPYCCCRWVQPAVRAALAVVKRNAIDWRSIEAVRVETFAEACAQSTKVPETSEEAQYGGPYPVAAALDCEATTHATPTDASTTNPWLPIGGWKAGFNGGLLSVRRRSLPAMKSP